MAVGGGRPPQRGVHGVGMVGSVMVVVVVAVLFAVGTEATERYEKEPKDDPEECEECKDAFWEWSHAAREYRDKLVWTWREWDRHRKREYEEFWKKELQRYTTFRQRQIDYYNWYVAQQKQRFHEAAEVQHQYYKRYYAHLRVIHEVVWTTYINVVRLKMEQIKPRLDIMRFVPPKLASAWSYLQALSVDLERRRERDLSMVDAILAGIDRHYEFVHKFLDAFPEYRDPSVQTSGIDITGTGHAVTQQD